MAINTPKKKLIEGGLFIAHEGGEGAGKTTRARILHDRLAALGYDVLITHEPGGTKLGQQLRTILLDGDLKKADIDGFESLFIFSADRHANVRKIIKPALAAGKIVISDRYVFSTLVYQQYEGVPADIIDAVNYIATGGLLPDRTYWLDVDAETGLGRVAARHDAVPTKYDKAGLDFHRYVREEFRKLHEQLPEQITRLDSSLPDDEVAETLYQDVLELIASRS